MWIERLNLFNKNKIYLSTEFGKFLIELLRDRIDFYIQDDTLEIYEKKGLISEKRDFDWFVYWIQNIFWEEVVGELVEEHRVIKLLVGHDYLDPHIYKLELEKRIRMLNGLSCYYDKIIAPKAISFIKKMQTKDNIYEILESVRIVLKYS